MLGALGAAVSVWSLPDEWRLSAFLAFVTLTTGLLSVEALRDRETKKEQARIELEAAENRNRLEARMDDVFVRLAGVVDSGSLKDRTIRLALELQNFALDTDEEAHEAGVDTRTRAYHTQVYNAYKRRFGTRVTGIERELREAEVLDESAEDHILPTIICGEDPPGSSEDPFYNSEEWLRGPRSVDAIANFFWQRAADL
ncbi:MAG TPA: hypothetical protein VN380_13350 [Thermoanaerobaculia bacterium]|nr:hypothetical protein [Thermoanaerobaculia bacterium]